jgi:hypothetical protein
LDAQAMAAAPPLAEAAGLDGAAEAAGLDGVADDGDDDAPLVHAVTSMTATIARTGHLSWLLILCSSMSHQFRESSESAAAARGPERRER